MPSEPDINPASRASVNADAADPNTKRSGEGRPDEGRSHEEKAYEPTPVVRAEHAEDQVTRLIEQQAAKLPSDTFLFLAIGAMGLSLALEVTGRRDAGRFVGLWAPTLLTMGVYNKIVKTLRPQ